MSQRFQYGPKCSGCQLRFWCSQIKQNGGNSISSSQRSKDFHYPDFCLYCYCDVQRVYWRFVNAVLPLSLSTAAGNYSSSPRQCKLAENGAKMYIKDWVGPSGNFSCSEIVGVRKGPSVSPTIKRNINFCCIERGWLQLLCTIGCVKNLESFDTSSMQSIGTSE